MQHPMVNKTFLIVILFINLTYNAMSENTLPDSIFKLVETKLSFNDVDTGFFDSLLIDRPSSDYLIGMKGYYLAWNKKNEIAESFLNEKLKSDSSLQFSSYINLGIGSIFYYKNQQKKAKEFYDKSIEYDLKKENKWIRLQLYYFYSKSDIALAKQYLLQALDIDSDFPIVKIELANVYADEGELNTATDILKNVINEKPNSYASYCLGLVYIKAKKIGEAKESFKEAIGIEPFALAYIGLGFVDQYYLIDDDSAIVSYNEAIKLDSLNSLPYFHLGVLFLKKEQYEEAIKNFDYAINIKPEEKSYEQLVYTYAMMKNFEKAKEINDESLKKFDHYIDNDFWEILLLYKNNLLKEGDEKLKEFYKNYTDPDIEWLKSGLSDWGYAVEKKK